ncbi:MAG TPA: RES family NAD+ phosphorylase [Microthrixaceae bacterium]|nr:RES family NAD+ phosphorylase [Microthrixaceae bacterium]
MTWPPCGLDSCPVPEPVESLLTQTRTTDWEEGGRCYRTIQSSHPAHQLVAGRGDTRFAPIAGASHVYLGRTATVTLLEVVFRDTANRAMYRASLDGLCTAPVTLRRPVTLIDLRDEELKRLGIAREALVATEAEHYPCTQAWARALHDHQVDGMQSPDGIVWHSRQGDLYKRRHRGGVLGDLLTHANVEVAVVWGPPAARSLLLADGEASDLRDASGEPSQLIVELANLLQYPIL